MPVQVDGAEANNAVQFHQRLAVATNSLDDVAATLPPMSPSLSKRKRATRSQRRRHSRNALQASSEIVRASVVQRLPGSESVVPGTLGQYRKPVFHERPEHVAV